MRQLLTGQLLDATKPMFRSTTRQDKPVDVVADSLRRVERNFGRVHLAESDVMTEGAAYRNQRAAHDYLYPELRGSTVARYLRDLRGPRVQLQGVRRHRRVQPEEGPYAAVDGSLLTSWIAAPFVDPRGSWIELRFPGPTIIGRTSLRFDLLDGAGVRKLQVEHRWWDPLGDRRPQR